MLQLSMIIKYVKTKTGTYDIKVYTTFSGSNVLKEGVECKSFTIIPIDFLHVQESKYSFQIYLDNCAYKSVYKKMIDNQIDPDDHLDESDEDQFFGFNEWVL